MFGRIKEFPLKKRKKRLNPYDLGMLTWLPFHPVRSVFWGEKNSYKRPSTIKKKCTIFAIILHVADCDFD